MIAASSLAIPEIIWFLGQADGHDLAGLPEKTALTFYGPYRYEQPLAILVAYARAFLGEQVVRRAELSPAQVAYVDTIRVRAETLAMKHEQVTSARLFENGIGMPKRSHPQMLTAVGEIDDAIMAAFQNLLPAKSIWERPDWREHSLLRTLALSLKMVVLVTYQIPIDMVVRTGEEPVVANHAREMVHLLADVLAWESRIGTNA